MVVAVLVAVLVIVRLLLFLGRLLVKGEAYAKGGVAEAFAAVEKGVPESVLGVCQRVEVANGRGWGS